MPATHRLPEWWDRPTEFNPERFTPNSAEDRMHRYRWAPFGGGAHKCIGLYVGGMQVKSIIHHMLLNYQWDVPADYEPPWEVATGLFPADGLPVHLQPLDPTIT